MSNRAIELAGKFLDGAADEAELAELAALLRSDPEARRTLARLMNQHATLRWMHASIAAVPARRARPARWIAAAAACLAIAAGAAWIWRPGGPPAVATIVEADPSVVVERDGRTLPAARGMDLRTGDAVRTQDAATARLRYAGEATTVELRGETRLRLAPSAEGKRLEILAGTIEADVAPQPAGRPMVLASPHAEVRVVGTVLTVAAASDQTRVEVEKGAVRVTDRKEGKAVELPAGNFVVAAPGVELRPKRAAVEVSESLRNGDFETGDLAGWSDRENQRNRKLAVAEEFRHSGRFGARLTGSGGFDQRIRTIPGKTYHVGAWVRIESVQKPPTWGGIRVGAYPEGAGHDRWKPIKYYPFVTTAKELPHIWAVVPPQTWHRVRFTFTARSEVTTFRLDHFTDGKLEIWADDIAVSPDPLPD